jgi:hypothetical protein
MSKYHNHYKNDHSDAESPKTLILSVIFLNNLHIFIS